MSQHMKSFAFAGAFGTLLATPTSSTSADMPMEECFVVALASQIYCAAGVGTTCRSP